jgi:hypothetical protein
MPLRPRLLPIPAFAALLLMGALAGAEEGSIPLSPEPFDRGLASETLYETVLPVDELVPEGWTPEQQRKLRLLPARLGSDERILLIIRTTVDPIGSREENERWATDLSRAVAARLARSGIPEDRMRVLPGAEDTRLFDEPRWEGFARRQFVSLRVVRRGEPPRPQVPLPDRAGGSAAQGSPR